MPNDLLVLLLHARRLHARGLFRGDVLILQEARKGLRFSRFLLFMVIPSGRKIPSQIGLTNHTWRETRGALAHFVLTLAVLQAEANTLTLKLPFYLPYTEIIRS